MSEKEEKDKNQLEEAERFAEENRADGTWIPLGFAWDSPGKIRERARDMEEFAAEELNEQDKEKDKEKH